MNMTIKQNGWNQEYATRFGAPTKIPSVFIDPVYMTRGGQTKMRKRSTKTRPIYCGTSSPIQAGKSSTVTRDARHLQDSSPASTSRTLGSGLFSLLGSSTRSVLAGTSTPLSSSFFPPTSLSPLLSFAPP